MRNERKKKKKKKIKNRLHISLVLLRPESESPAVPQSADRFDVAVMGRDSDPDRTAIGELKRRFGLLTFVCLFRFVFSWKWNKMASIRRRTRWNRRAEAASSRRRNASNPFCSTCCCPCASKWDPVAKVWSFGFWFLVFGFWFLVFEFWILILILVFGFFIWLLKFGFWFLVFEF